jgi:PAS domain S-box-containing protein
LATLLTAISVDWYFFPPYGAASLDAINIARGAFFCFSFGLICWLVDRRTIRAEARIERQLRLLDLAVEPIIVRDAEDRITFWNTGAERLYGWTREEALGQNIHDLLQTSFPNSFEAIRSELLQTGRWHGELEHTRKDGTHVLVESWWTLEQTNGKQIAVMEANFDLTLRKQAQRVLIQSEKLASVGRLTATIAHEVNNPLAGAMNALFLASTDPALPDQARDNLRLADHELRRAAHITAQTLVFCRETGSRTRLELPKLIDEVLGVYARKLQDRGITVLRRQRCGLCRTNCDYCLEANSGELRQVISNLLANAIDALQDQGALHIRLSHISFKDSVPKVRLTIADNGCGIRTEHLKRIFEPFFTTKESLGTGLGLWITEQIVCKYAGSIRVRSKPQKGTVFCMSLPAMAGERGGKASTESLI